MPEGGFFHFCNYRRILFSLELSLVVHSLGILKANGLGAWAADSDWGFSLFIVFDILTLIQGLLAMYHFDFYAQGLASWHARLPAAVE